MLLHRFVFWRDHFRATTTATIQPEEPHQAHSPLSPETEGCQWYYLMCNRNFLKTSYSGSHLVGQGRPGQPASSIWWRAVVENLQIQFGVYLVVSLPCWEKSQKWVLGASKASRMVVALPQSWASCSITTPRCRSVGVSIDPYVSITAFNRRMKYFTSRFPSN